eukprot:s2363_g2.t1
MAMGSHHPGRLGVLSHRSRRCWTSKLRPAVLLVLIGCTRCLAFLPSSQAPRSLNVAKYSSSSGKPQAEEATTTTTGSPAAEAVTSDPEAERQRLSAEPAIVRFDIFLAAMANSRGITLQCSSSTQPAEILADADPSLLAVPGLHEGGVKLVNVCIEKPTLFDHDPFPEGHCDESQELIVFPVPSNPSGETWISFQSWTHYGPDDPASAPNRLLHEASRQEFDAVMNQLQGQRQWFRRHIANERREDELDGRM